MRILYLNDVVADRDVHVTSRYQISRSLEKLGHKVRCTLFFEEKIPDVAGLPLARFVRMKGGKRYSPLFKMWSAAGAILFSRADVVLYEPSFWPAAAVKTALSFGRKRMIMDIRSVPVDVESGLKGKLRALHYRLALKAAARLSHGLTVITPGLRAEVCSALGLNESRVGTWSSGVDMKHFLSKRPAGTPSGNGFDLCAAYHGVISRTRGLQEVVPAIRMLKDEGIKVRLLLIGDGPAGKELAALASSEGVEEQVVFAGKVPYDDVPGMIDQCDIGVVPLPDCQGWRVSSPLKLMEYSAMARPVIVSPIEAHKQVLGTSNGAFYLDDVSGWSIAAALKTALSKKDSLAGLGLENRRIVEQGYSWDAQAEKLQDYM